MKFWFSFLVVLCSLQSRSQTKLDLKKDFGAKGDGRTNDTEAFIRASKRINELKKNITFFIPAGTYLVQPQKATAPENISPFTPVDLISLQSCSNISIIGVKGSKILYMPGLYFGSFQRKGKGFEKLSQRTVDWKYRVAIGHGINLENCQNITIRSLEFDGNNRSFNLGGEFGDVGMQIDNDGLFLKDVSGFMASNLNFHHFGRDGILVINKTPKGFSTGSQHIVLSNCQFEYNGRQGLSWAGGVGLVATNCSFSYTGKTKFSSPPGAGVDFEPNAGNVLRDGKFVNCIFRSNNGVAVIADEGGTTARDIQFINSTIQGETTHALWVKSPSFSFVDCKINGSFLFGFPADDKSDGTSFIRCIFSDRYSKAAVGNYLVESNGARYLKFSDCVFRAENMGLVYINAGASNDAENVIIENCRMITAYKSKEAKGMKLGAYSTGVDFVGNTRFIDSSVSRPGWNMERSRFINSSQNSPIVFTKNAGAGSYDTVRIGDGRTATTVQVNDMAVFLMLRTSKLVVEKGATLVVKNGGTFWAAPEAEVLVKGKLVLEDGSFLCIHTEAKISETSIQNIVIKGKGNFSENPNQRLGLGGCRIIN